jgi:hypothetical protein
MPSLLGNGTTIALTSPSVTIGSVVSIQQGGQSVEPIEDDHLGATGDHEFIYGKLRMNGPEVIVAIFDPDDVPVASPTPSTITLTYPPKTGQTNGATKAGTGALIRCDPQSIENDQRLLCEIELHWDGKTGPTRADGS